MVKDPIIRPRIPVKHSFQELVPGSRVRASRFLRGFPFVAERVSDRVVRDVDVRGEEVDGVLREVFAGRVLEEDVVEAAAYCGAADAGGGTVGWEGRVPGWETGGYVCESEGCEEGEESGE